MLNAIEALPEIMDLLHGQFEALNAKVSGQKKDLRDSLLIGARGTISFNILQHS